MTSNDIFLKPSFAKEEFRNSPLVQRKSGQVLLDIFDTFFVTFSFSTRCNIEFEYRLGYRAQMPKMTIFHENSHIQVRKLRKHMDEMIAPSILKPDLHLRLR